MNKQIYLTLALILSTCIGLLGCYPESPDDGGNPNKEDPNKEESNAEVAEWFVRNGFSKPQKSEISDKTYTSENDYYTLLIMEGGQGIAFSFTAKEEAPTPPPAEDTSIFPSYNFGEKFNPADVPTPGTPAGSIYTSEMDKGEEVTYNAPIMKDSVNLDYSSTRLQVLIKDPSKIKTSAINGYYYYPSYDATEATMHVYDNGGLAINHAQQFKTGIDKELKAALEKGGYQYTGTEKSNSGTEYWFYYNAKHKVSLHVVKYKGLSFLSASFWPGDDYKPQAGTQIRPNMRYLRH